MFYKTVKTIGTHDGSFHTDDVFSVATLLMLYPSAKVTRTRDANVLNKQDIVVDVGGVYDDSTLRYDHHQLGYKESHKNGILRCGFGLIWKHYGMHLAKTDFVFNAIDDGLVATIDGLDNGQQIYNNDKYGTNVHTISDYIENHNPTNRNPSYEQYNTAFFATVPLAQDYLIILIKKFQQQEADSRLFDSYYAKSDSEKYVVLPESINFANAVYKYAKLLYVIFKRPDGDWCVRAVAKNPKEPFVQKKPFPNDWRAKTNADLQKVTGVKTAKFCHRAGFLAVTTNKDDAILLAQKSISLQI